MLSRALQYQSLKVVLQQMDPNVRFQINLHMSSIRNVKKLVPLKVHYLDMDESHTFINDTSYSLGIVRHYPDGNSPEPIRREQCGTGCAHDFDEFGFQVSSGANFLLPGDIPFQLDPWTSPFKPQNTEQMERRHRANLRAHEKALEKLTELKTKGVPVDDFLRSIQRTPSYDEFLDENAEIWQDLHYDSDRLSYFIEEDKLKLLPFECRKNNTKPPFTCYIQLTIDKGRTRTIRRFEYTKKLFEAVKNLNEVLFGGRTMPMHVGTLNFIYSRFEQLRLPVGFRLKVLTVQDFYGNKLADKGFSLLVENSESLHTLWLSCIFDPVIVGSQSPKLQESHH